MKSIHVLNRTKKTLKVEVIFVEKELTPDDPAYHAAYALSNSPVANVQSNLGNVIAADEAIILDPLQSRFRIVIENQLSWRNDGNSSPSQKKNNNNESWEIFLQYLCLTDFCAQSTTTERVYVITPCRMIFGQILVDEYECKEVIVDFNIYRQTNTFTYDNGREIQERIISKHVTDFADNISRIAPTTESDPMIIPSIIFQPATLLCALTSKAIYSGTTLPQYAPFDDGNWQCLRQQDVGYVTKEFACWAIWRPSAFTETVFLTFRGTDIISEGFQDLLVDMAIIPYQIDETNLFVFGGVYASILNEWSRLLIAMQELVAMGIKKVMVTGHSLGGALAQMFIFQLLRLKHEHIELMTLTFEAITFAAPMVLCVIGELDTNYQSLVQEWRSTCTNFTLNNDYISFLPRVCSNSDYLKRLRELFHRPLPNMLLKTLFKYFLSDDLLVSLSSNLVYTQHYRSAAHKNIIILWAEDKVFPEATNRPCVHVLNPDQIEQLASLPLYEHWEITSQIAQDHEMNQYIRVLQEMLIVNGCN